VKADGAQNRQRARLPHGARVSSGIPIPRAGDPSRQRCQ
jgi:hypothetical protein